MNTLLATNILLAIITGSILAVAITLIVLLSHIISISRKAKNVAHVLEGDVMRARSAVMAIGKKIVQTVRSKKKKD